MRSAVVAASLGLLLLLGDRGVAAQERIVVLTEPGTPVVVTEILLAVGPADEERTTAGLANLSARSVLAQVEPVLDSLGARAGVTAHKDALSFTVTAAPEVWEESAALLLGSILRETPDSLTVLRERRAIAAELRGRVANPADAATREVDRAFYGADHPWGRPTVGTAESVERLGYSHVRAFLRDNFTADRAYVAVVGPVDVAPARAHLRPLVGTTFPAPVEVIPFDSDTLPARHDYDAVTTWITATYRFPETADVEALHFIAYFARDALAYSPAQRSVYNAWSEIVPRVGGGEIRVQVVVPPDEADRWTERVETIVAELATVTLIDDIFEAHLRRFHGERVMALISPEARAHAATRRLYVTGDSTGIIPEPDGPSLERIRAAARTLDVPTIVVLGPTLD
jgi:predicted Zn-dependent peptidase